VRGGERPRGRCSSHASTSVDRQRRDGARRIERSAGRHGHSRGDQGHQAPHQPRASNFSAAVGGEDGGQLKIMGATRLVVKSGGARA